MQRQADYSARFRKIILMCGGNVISVVRWGFVCLLLLPGIIFPITGHSSVQARYALVIGNGDCSKGKLKNPANDANDMADLFASLGYKVYSGGALVDIGLTQMKNVVENFASDLPDGASAVYYFAGHGMADGGDNYLLPTDFTWIRTRLVSHSFPIG